MEDNSQPLRRSRPIFNWSVGSVLPVAATSLTVLAGLLPAISVIRRVIAALPDSAVPVDVAYSLPLVALITDGAVALTIVGLPWAGLAIFAALAAPRIYGLAQYTRTSKPLFTRLKRDMSALKSVNKEMERLNKEGRRLLARLSQLPEGSAERKSAEAEIDRFVERSSTAISSSDDVRLARENMEKAKPELDALVANLADALGVDPNAPMTPRERLMRAVIRFLVSPLLLAYLVFMFVFDTAFPAAHVMLLASFVAYRLVTAAAEQTGQISLRVTVLAAATIAVATGTAYGLTPWVPRPAFVRAAGTGHFDSGWYAILAQTDSAVFLRFCDATASRVLRVPQSAVAAQEYVATPYSATRLSLWESVLAREIRVGIRPGCTPHPESP